jgi:electron transport complex protein RnfD
MWTVFFCLLPAAGWGVYVFGVRALAVLLTAVLSAVVAEAIAARMVGRRTIHDGSAAVAGLLVGMTMPPAVPIAIPAVASAFAMLVVKWSFGGLGTNWMNPALAGRVFVFFSWTGPMQRWVMPGTLPVPDGFSTATPLGIAKAAQNGTNIAGGPLAILREAGYPVSPLDTTVTEWLNANVLEPLGIDLPSGYVDPFLGNVPGSIGEVSAALLLLGTVVLFARRIIRWEIPTAYFLSFAVLTRLFGGLPYGQELLTGDVLFATLTGGLILAVFFMATDTVTSPLTATGKVIYGAGAGFLTFVLRMYGQFPEAVALAIILMNVFVPLINRVSQPRRFGLSRHEMRARGQGVIRGS